MRVLVLMAILWGVPSYSAETDSWVGQEEFLEDAAPVINAKTNELFDVALARANAEGACNEELLYKYMRKSFRNRLWDKLNRWINKTDDIQRQETRVRKSVFRDFHFWNAWVLGGALKLINAPLAGIIQMGPYRVGSDKFEHFMGSGFRYFKQWTREGLPLEVVLTKGRKTELGILGARSTGVISHADLVANFNGMRWWNHVLAKNPDVLGEEFQLGPYVACQGGQWVRLKDYDWLNYLDAGFDEAINCNSYKNAKLANRVEKRIAELEAKTGHRLQCLSQNPILQGLVKTKYQPVAPYLFPKAVFEPGSEEEGVAQP